MKYTYKIILTIFFFYFSKVLNESVAGADAQKRIKDKFTNDAKKISGVEKKLKSEELDIIKQKKIITNEEYQKKVKELRIKVAKLQKDKQQSFEDLTNLRNQSKKRLLEELNPLMKDYMEKNKIRIVLDKKSILLGDSTLDLTKIIMDLLDKKVKSIK